ncbi:MAG TPA: hypothetical protein VIY51_09400 [Xanthobacteraceae bacterium]
MGLVLVQSNSSSAEQEQFRTHVAPVAHHSDAARNAAKQERALSLLKAQVHDLRQKVGTIDSMRKELNGLDSMREELVELKAKLWGQTALTTSFVLLPKPQSVAVVEPKEVTLKLPDLIERGRLTPTPKHDQPEGPLNPATASLPAVIEERSPGATRAKSAVEEAKTYLINTATPGYTMLRQGPEVAIGRLHPDFIVKLAAAIKLARQAGMTSAGVFSAYRPPVFGVGGFSDKFNSLHSYGLAVDMTGIGSAGSKSARRWQAIVNEVGLHLPYGANNHAEFNHTQLVPTKMASAYLRATITGNGPRDLPQMWLASGVSSHVDDIELADAPNLVVSDSSPAIALPPVRKRANQGKIARQSGKDRAVQKTSQRQPSARLVARQAGKDRAVQKTSQRQPPAKQVARQAGKDRAIQKTSQQSSAKLAFSPRSRSRRPNLAWMYEVLAPSET